jgi:hypothetical protein
MPRCKHCKEKFEPVRFNQKFCLEAECVAVWVEQEKAKSWLKKKKEMKRDLETVQDLMKKAQKVFNEFIRLRDKDKPCISCNRLLKGKFDAGHYHSSGGHKAVTFHEDNVHGQCVYCNRSLHGNLINYQLGIAKRIGADKLIELNGRAHDEYKPTREELRHLINFYKEKVAELKKNN